MASWVGPPKEAMGQMGGPFQQHGQQSLVERKRQLLEWLASRGASQAGYSGRVGSAVGRQGGMGGKAPLPSMSYNPFFAQIAGRNENFDSNLPQGIAASAAHAVQAGGVGPGMGLAPGTQTPFGGFRGGGGMLGAPQGVGPGVDQAPGMVQPNAAPQSAPAAGYAQPSGGYGGRSVIGYAPPPPPLQAMISNGMMAQSPFQLQPWQPSRYAAAGMHGTYRE